MAGITSLRFTSYYILMSWSLSWSSYFFEWFSLLLKLAHVSELYKLFLHIYTHTQFFFWEKNDIIATTQQVCCNGGRLYSSQLFSGRIASLWENELVFPVLSFPPPPVDRQQRLSMWHFWTAIGLHSEPLSRVAKPHFSLCTSGAQKHATWQLDLVVTPPLCSGQN